jgi:tetratricopeptide (TPR) repeat protein
MHILLSVLLVLAVSTNSRAEQNDTSDKPPLNNAASEQSVTFKSLAQMNELIALGVPALALSLLDEEQKKRQPFTADWYAFEYKRILLMSALEQWQQILQRTQWLFDTSIPEKQITHKIRLWFETQQVMARLQLKQSEQALSQLQALLWDTSPEQRDQSLPAIWRRLVIRSYLQMQRDDDARRALVRYELDYKTDEMDIDWIMLQAQVLMRTNRPQQAIQLLQQLPSDEAKALTLIAKLQSEPKEAKKINQQMRELLDGAVLTRSARWAYSYVAYQAATVLSDLPAQINNLEAMLSLGIESPVFDENYQVTADDLWELYNKRGLIIANEKALLFGNDEQWQKLSDKLLKSDPEKALALNAALVLNTENFVTKQQQHKTIVEIIEQRKNGLELINQLYLHSNKVTDVNVLPDEVRYRLVDYALSEGDLNEAATLMESLQEPPQGKTVFDWRMRKARVLILQGKYQQSEDLIRRTFAEKPSITHAELDRYIQVVFDFQTVQQHQQAINLFELLYFEGLDEKIKREIYFWKAESFFSMGQYDRAALNYLESARALSGEENDLWAQSARFKAGNALILAGIYDDAEKVYSELLLVTDSDSRKALINQNLQKIRLLKSTKNNDVSVK